MYVRMALREKVHFVMHTCPVPILCSVGPLVNSWYMRMEAKNAYFKKVARVGNFVNVPYSVAKRHQLLMCAYLQGKFFTYHELECGPCKWHKVCSEFCYNGHMHNVSFTIRLTN